MSTIVLLLCIICLLPTATVWAYHIRDTPLDGVSPTGPDCPFCRQSLAGLDRDDTMLHFLTNHVDDQVRGHPISGVQLPCGCPHVRWPIDDFRPEEIVPHLEREHGLRV